MIELFVKPPITTDRPERTATVNQHNGCIDEPNIKKGDRTATCLYIQ